MPKYYCLENNVVTNIIEADSNPDESIYTLVDSSCDADFPNKGHVYDGDESTGGGKDTTIKVPLSIGDIWSPSENKFLAKGPSADENGTEASQLIQNTNWTQLADSGLTPDCVAAYAAFRAELKAITANPQAGFIDWPEEPVKEYL